LWSVPHSVFVRRCGPYSGHRRRSTMIEAVLLLLGLVVIGVITAANGYFVAQDLAYMSAPVDSGLPTVGGQ
jgi:hypothetical protein